MSYKISEATEDDNTDCYLQQADRGTLICRAARGHTNEVNRTICFNCDVGKIFRETNCDAVFPKLRIIKCETEAYFNAPPKRRQPSTRYYLNIESMFCKHRKRETTLDLCRTCDRATP